MYLFNYWLAACTTLVVLVPRRFSARNNSSSLLTGLDCDFDNSTFCGWENDKTGRATFNWTLWSGPTPSERTGPQADASGNGTYAYLAASFPRQHGDTARLISPRIQGEKCMSFLYNMYGWSMGSLIVYMKTKIGETVEWIKSGDHPDRWFEAAVFLNSSVEYQIVLEGVIGFTFSSDIAIDNITFVHGSCRRLVTQTLYAFIKDDTTDFKLDRVPANGGWIHQFTLQAVQTRNSTSDVMYFVYPVEEGRCAKSVTRQLSLTDLNCLPRDFLYASSINRSDDRKVTLINRGDKMSYGIVLDDHHTCCGQAVEEHFFANVSLPKPNFCPPGWRAAGESCIFLQILPAKTWRDARVECHNRGGRLSVFENTIKSSTELNPISKLVDESMKEEGAFYVGANAISTGQWITVNNQLFDSKSTLWGLREPSGDGWCGAILKRRGQGWRINDVNCYRRIGFVCQKQQNPHGSKCDDGWSGVEDSCFRVFAGNAFRSWNLAREYCFNQGGDLAVVDSENKRKLIASNLTTMSNLHPNITIRAFVGLRKRGAWQWLGGQNISPFFWHTGYPYSLWRGECAILIKGISDWRLSQTSCSYIIGFLCDTNERTHISGQQTSHSSYSDEVRPIGKSFYAVDGNIASCLTIKRENGHQLWWSVRFSGRAFVYKIWIFNRQDCCFKEIPTLRVVLRNSGQSKTANCKVYDWKVKQRRLIICQPSIMATDIAIVVDRANYLTLCEVMVTASDDDVVAHGVLQELWYNIPSASITSLQADGRFPNNPDVVTVLQSFAAPSDFYTNYGQRLTAYLQVPESGNYTFDVVCADTCELWLDTSQIDKPGSNNQEEETGKVLFAKIDVGYRTNNNQWDKFPPQTSSEISLSTCHLYPVEILMKQAGEKGGVSVGMKLPNGTHERPIRKENLFWVWPGAGFVEFKINSIPRRINVKIGKTIFIQATYKYCCRGSYCPGCPVDLYLKFSEEKILVHRGLPMDCREHNFSRILETLLEEGIYKIDVTYAILDSVSHLSEVSREIAQVNISAVHVEGCKFISNLCSWGNKDQGWKLAAFDKGVQARFNAGKPAVLESPWIFASSIYQRTGLCLSFSYLLPTHSESSLSVTLVTSSNSSLWSLRGYQGSTWLTGQVTFIANEDFKIVVIAECKKASDSYCAAVDNISIYSKRCERSPSYSTPDFTCKNHDTFQCDNGQCVSKDLVCDGDRDCVDNSDEKSCRCLSSQFACPTGECLSVEKLCDSKKGCEDRTDEARCGGSCSKDQFSCAGGGCVPWSLTCDGGKNCEDGSDEPSICDSMRCPLVNLTCAWSNKNLLKLRHCVGNRVKCNFEDGLCGMKQESRIHYWQIGSGSTPTKNTGPNYDHTTFLPSGKYIFLEASTYSTGEAAILASSAIDAGKATCVQFWYHMKGKDIGSLNVYIQTNESRTLLWSRIGEQGDNWNFGQAGQKGDSKSYKIILEGVFGNGIHGDIAVDDFYLLEEEECPTVHGNESPNCLFELDHCAWNPGKTWLISKRFPIRDLKQDWQNNSGGFTYFRDCTQTTEFSSYGSLLSPRIPPRAEWKCLQFWFYLGTDGFTSLQVSLVYNKTKLTLWSSNWNRQKAGHWYFVRLPINSSSESYEVVFEGQKNSRWAIIALDDIVFQMESCQRIPWQKESMDYGKNPLSSKHFWKLDGTDKNIWLEGTAASYQIKGGFKSLSLVGRDGNAAIPAVDFRKSSFSIAIRFNVQDIRRQGHLISDWSPPYQFRVFVANRLVHVQLRGSGERQDLLIMDSKRFIYPNVWTHVVFVWNRSTLKGTLYLDGEYSSETASKYHGSDIDLKLTNHTSYELGFKRDSKHVLHGFLRDLAVFLRPLKAGEVFILYSPTRALCPVRSTTAGGCCDFPFVYKNTQHNTCTSDHFQYFFCRETSNNQQQQTLGRCSLHGACFEFNEGLCGWMNSNQKLSPWRQVLKPEMESSTNLVNLYLKKKGWNLTPGSAKEMNYQLDFVENHTAYVNISDLPDLSEFTVCFWMKTSDNTSAGTPIWYRVRYKNKGKYVPAIALVDYRGFYVYIGESNSTKTSSKANDGKWHHICLVWTSVGGNFTIYNDEIAMTKTGFSDGEKIPGRGEFIVGVTEQQARVDAAAGQFIGLISSVNIFDKALDRSVITWMSYGCGENLYNAIVPWSQFSKGFVGDIKLQRPASCADIEGYRYMAFSNTTSQSSQPSLFQSPMYERFYEGHVVCMRFRYLLYGSGKRVLRLYQQLDLINHTRRLMWAVNESSNTDVIWKYGRVAVPSVTKYRVSLEASLGSEPGHVSVRGVHVIPGYCGPIPLTAVQVCDRNFTNSSGFIFSPHYPGYYPPLTRCHWIISVPRGNVIKLRFMEFQLEEHPFCYNDFIEVYSGWANARRKSGRYCGQRFPTFLQSSSNFMEIIFVSNHRITRSGFKLHYTSEKDTGQEECIQYEGCPSSCECTPISPKRKEMVITVRKGRELTDVPEDIPSDAAVMLFQRNKISLLNKKQFSGLSRLKYLDLSGNRIFRIKTEAFSNTSSLETLKLDMNFISSLSDGILGNIESLNILDLSSNLIKDIPSTAFVSLTSLTTLSLRENRINRIDKDAFKTTGKLQHLYLQANLLEDLPGEVFIGLSSLKILYLNNNKIRRLSSQTFAGLSSLEKLNLQNNLISLKNFPPDVFNGLQSLKEIHLDEFILCCYAEKAVPGVHCNSPKDEFSSCSDLMKNRGVQVCVWILGLTALLGNIFAILMRVIVKEDNNLHSFLLSNLAISDLLMGIYLLIIAITDVQWQGEYFKHDFDWRSGTTCAFTGVLSMISSEVSVLMLTLITTDRLICIVFPFKFKRMSRSLAYFVVGGIWVFGIVISAIPTLGFDYFYDHERNVGFFGKSAVCLPLQLSTERQAGWEYAVAIFIALNFASFIYILIANAAMFMTVRRISRRVRSTQMNREFQVARRMVFIILTDFLCWMPVIIIGLLSVVGKFHDPEKQAYVWIAVFVLPVNSSINPLLYTFSTPIMTKRLRQYRDSLRGYIERLFSQLKRNSVQPEGVVQVVLSDLQMNHTPRLSVSSRLSTQTRSSETIQDCEGPEVDLKLIERQSLLPEETSHSVGFVVAQSGNGKSNCMRLIKHFAKGMDEDWKKEAELVMELNAEGAHPNILKYLWHCTTEECAQNYKPKECSRLNSSSFLLCYDFTASTPLDDYLKDSEIVFNMDTLLAVATDLINAIEYMDRKCIVHNSITTSNVLIGEGYGIPPITAVLGGFGSAQRVSEDFPECSKDAHSMKDLLGKNIIQFGFVLSKMMKKCCDLEKYEELQQVVNLCLLSDSHLRPNASQVQEQLTALWFRNDIWDTAL